MPPQYQSPPPYSVPYTTSHFVPQHQTMAVPQQQVMIMEQQLPQQNHDSRQSAYAPMIMQQHPQQMMMYAAPQMQQQVMMQQPQAYMTNDGMMVMMMQPQMQIQPQPQQQQPVLLMQQQDGTFVFVGQPGNAAGLATPNSQAVPMMMLPQQHQQQHQPMYASPLDYTQRVAPAMMPPPPQQAAVFHSSPFMPQLAATGTVVAPAVVQQQPSQPPQVTVGGAPSPHSFFPASAGSTSAAAFPPSVVVAGTSVGSLLRSSTTEMNQSNSQSQRPPTDVAVWGYAVVDQCHLTLQRVPIPPSVVTKTRGEALYNNVVQASSTRPCTSTVCLKFTTRSEPESCAAGSSCANFHIERDYLDQARSVAEPLCCGLHNDYFTHEMMSSNCAPSVLKTNIALVLEDRSEIELQPYQLSWTVGLEQLPVRGYNAQATKLINIKKQVCRLHLEGKCKWTKDCGHVHLCRELHRLLGKFHFPSLMFLLSTEANSDVVLATIAENPAIGEFIRSSCVIPLVSSLVEKKMKTALEVLLQCGVAIALPQVAMLAELGIPVNPKTANIVHVSEKIVPFISKPGHHRHQEPSSSQSPPDKDRIPITGDAVASDDANLSSAASSRYAADGPPLGLPSFVVVSPGASLTSAPSGDHHGECLFGEEH
jgi:hypothetical protein